MTICPVYTTGLPKFYPVEGASWKFGLETGGSTVYLTMADAIRLADFLAQHLPCRVCGSRTANV